MIANVRLDLGLDELCAAAAAPAGGRSALRVREGSRVVCPVSRARDGLWWVLARFGVGVGDEVLIPGFMCDTAGDAVAATGARLVTYGLVDGTFRPSVELCRQALSSATKALIVPHLFGIPTSLGDFADLAERHRLLLIEDSALVFPAAQDALENYDSPAACVVYSYNYGKPLALGWGGLVSLTPSLVERVGLPEAVPMDEEDDRFYAAALLVGHIVLDAGRLRGVARADAGLHLLTTSGGERRPAVPDRAAVDGVLDAARKGPVALVAWCDTNLPSLRAAWSERLPSGIDGVAERARALVARAGGALRGPHAAEQGELLESLRPGGYAERLLEAERRALEEGSGAQARRALATVYASGLDGSRWLFPPADAARYWLSYPVVCRRAVPRDRLVRRVTRHLQVDVYPYVWPQVLHRVSRLRRAVTAGPGSANDALFAERLLNLPVHPQMTLEQAEALVAWLNAAV